MIAELVHLGPGLAGTFRWKYWLALDIGQHECTNPDQEHLS